MRRKNPDAWSSANRVCNHGIVKSSFQYKLILKDSPWDELSGFFFLPQRFQNIQYLGFGFNREREHPGEKPLFPRFKTCPLRRHIQLLTGLKASNLDASPKEFARSSLGCTHPSLHDSLGPMSPFSWLCTWVKKGEQKRLYMNLT